MSLISELKRRKLPQVAATYAVTAWLLMQLAVVIEEPLALPTWFDSLVIVLAILGFPLTLILSWAFNITPEGIVRDPGTDGMTEATRSSIRIEQVLIALLFVAVVVLLVDRFNNADTSSNEAAVADGANTLQNITADAVATNPETADAQDLFETENSIAVLPFTNLSNDSDQEYFSDGLTEELISTLSNINGLLVTGSSSSFYFKGSTESPQQIAAELGVSNILQGSVRKAGEQLRIVATLVDADTGFTLWNDTFDRQLADVFAIQEEIATAVTTAMSITFGVGEFNRPGMTRNVQAYDAWLQAKPAVFDSQPDNIQQMIEASERAVALDPDFALGWYQLARSYQAAFNFLEPEAREGAIARRNEAIANARRLAPDMPELGTSIPPGASIAERDRLILSSVEQTGNVEATSNLQYANFLTSVGRLQDAVRYSQRAFRLDPFNQVALMRLGQSQMWAGQLDAALENFDKALMLGDYNPGNPAWADIAFIETLKGNLDAAIAATGNLQATREDQLVLLQYMQDGNNEGGLAEIRRLMADPATNTALIRRHLVVFAALMGNPDLALEFVRRPNDAFEITSLVHLWGDFGNSVRPTEGFKQLVTDMGLVDYWRETGNWADKCRPLEGSDDFECF